MPRRRSPLSARIWAQLGIVIQFLALIRILAEYLRLKRGARDDLTRSVLDHYVVGALIAAVLCFFSVGLYFLQMYAFAAVVSGLTVISLLFYKFRVML